jgi:hypothetical protein
MTMANAKDETAAAPAPQPIPKDQQHPRDPSKRKPPRRCAKCAVPKPEAQFKGDKDGETSPYCLECRGRFPSLRAARIAAKPRKR